MLIESPCMALEKMILNRDKDRKNENLFIVKNIPARDILKSENNSDIADKVLNMAEEPTEINNGSTIYKLWYAL